MQCVFFYSCNIFKLKDVHKLQLAVYMFKLNSSLTVDYQNNYNYNTRYKDNSVPYFLIYQLHNNLIRIMYQGFGMSSH